MLQDLNVFKAENAKKNDQINELMQAITSYRKFEISDQKLAKMSKIKHKFSFGKTLKLILEQIYPSQMKISLVPRAINGFLEGQYKFVGLDASKFPIYKHTRVRLVTKFRLMISTRD